ncbi:methylated-DNA--protein-cysteine methyltransferase, constitutive [Lutzomyia longipalpis]|uniref:methylated-DNA--protein-cysteine methyltransferase, constitutive n=1 Tax=Lutzomyia longipalpis TaxID=7200 RepID=UPI0024844E60|nr:methylated-DNA--protein-cysteine methyltransferase, constitutive [Lutzomyia longipalpis]
MVPPISRNCGIIETPLGEMLATVSVGNRLEKLEFRDRVEDSIAASGFDVAELMKNTKKHPILLQVQQEMNEYFAGKRQKFNVPLVDDNHHLLAIPYGETWTYQELANYMGKPKGARYAGYVCKTNNVCIIIPCHRVVAKSGVVNYGAGPGRKIFLLDLEAKVTEDKLKKLK